MVRRFLAWGLLGWALEVGFTSISDTVWMRDRRMKGHSYLWMLPIYGSGGMLLEGLHEADVQDVILGTEELEKRP